MSRSREKLDWYIAETEKVDYDTHNIARRPVTDTFIQWKGTNVCLDFHCECGHNGHIDDFFCYSIECSQCGNVYGMPYSITPYKMTREESDADIYHEPITT